MEWYIWDGEMKNQIKVRYVFHYANMQKMDYHVPGLSRMQESCDTIGEATDMLYETDLALFRRLGLSASDSARERLRLSESFISEQYTNAFNDNASLLSSVNDLGESSRR
jgi:hypothetical protein